MHLACGLTASTFGGDQTVGLIVGDRLRQYASAAVVGAYIEYFHRVLLTGSVVAL